MRGRKPVPPQLRLVRGNPGKRSAKAAAQIAEPGMPEPPDCLDADGRVTIDWEAVEQGAQIAGDIHIDHDVPVRRFDPKDPAQLRQLWALTNIYPLWAIDNARKGARTRAQWMARDGSDRRHAA